MPFSGGLGDQPLGEFALGGPGSAVASANGITGIIELRMPSTASAFDSAFQADAFQVTGDEWVDITSDVRSTVPVRWTRGIDGNGPTDRVARIGELSFVLNNAQNNSAGLIGYYSPGHVNCRTGFQIGAGVRIRILHLGTTYTLWTGEIDDIDPEPGQHLGRGVLVTALDWMNHASSEHLTIANVLTDVRDPDVLHAVCDAMTTPPPARNFAAGRDVYAYAFDSARNDSTPMQEFQKVAQSGLGYIYLKGDGTLVSENRTTRSVASTNLVTIDNEMVALSAKRSRGQVINTVQAIVHQRRVDPNPTTVLYATTSPFVLAPSESKTIFGPYRDPAQEANRVGGLDLQTPIAAGTDYTANALADGSGADLTADLSVVTVTTANGVSFTISNLGGVDAHVTRLQIRGRGIYDYAQIVLQASGESVDSPFQNAIDFDMPYQNDVNVGDGASRALVRRYGSDIQRAEMLTLFPTGNDALTTTALAREIGDRIGVLEAVTGLTDADGKGFFINAVAGELWNRNWLKVTWRLAPADTQKYWLLGVPGRSELGVTTIPAPV